jgi:hypothetical protein
MTVTISGTTGITGPDGSASTPSLAGADTNTGLFFPAADTVAIATGGTERVRVSSTGEVTRYNTDPGGVTLKRTDGVNSNGWLNFVGSDDVVDGSVRMATDVANALTFLTAATEQARITSAGLFQFNSGYGSVATAYGCRAWVNFNGTGTVAIRASGNVSSITDNGTGDYTVNFTTAMPDANYAVSAWNNNPMGTLGSGTSLRCGGMQYEVSRTTSAFRNVTFAYVGSTNVGTAEDVSAIYLAVFR